MKKKQTAGLIAAVVVFAASYLIPTSDALARPGIAVLALALALLIVLATKALPLVVACLICVSVMPLCGITETFAGALSGFATRVPIFILASFALAEAYAKVPLSKRILISLLRSFGKSVRSVLFTMMLGAAIMSSVISNVPTCAIFMAIGLSFLDLYRDDVQRQRAGRAFMIGIPVASMIGGMMTPVGSSLNVYALTLLEEYTGETITFVQWMLAGIPLAVLALPVAWLLVIKTFKPDEVDARMVRSFINTLAVPEKLEPKEKKVLLITAVMLILWIASSWLPALDIAVISLLGGCVLFLPGVRILDMKSFLRDTGWEPVFLAGTLMSMGGAILEGGVAAWLGGLLPSVAALGPVPSVALCALVTFILLVIFPSAPAIIVFAAPAVFVQHAPAAMCIMALGLCACNCYLLPLDTVTRLTYGTGYYSAADMLKSTLPLQIWLIVIISLWIPAVSRFCGLA